VLFIIFPVLALVTALANYGRRDAKRVVYFFIIYFGLSFVIGHRYLDSGAYVQHFLYNATLPFSEFFNIIGGLYTSDTTVDIVEPFISFVVSRFTNDYRFLFGAYAAIFGFFYIRSINLLYDHYQEKKNNNALIFMVFFAFILPVTTINGFRMWTAAWVFFYGAYHVIMYRDKKFLLLALSACLIHWGFIAANIILILYFFAGNRNQIYFLLALTSFIIPNALLPFISSINIGGSLQNRIAGYTNEEYILGVQEDLQQTVWFVTLRNDLIFYFIIFSLAFIFFFYRRIMNENHEKNIFSFLLLFLSFVNFGKAIPSFGNRFMIVFLMFGTLYVFLFLLKFPGRKINLLTLLAIIPMFLYVAVEFRIGSEVINSWIFSPIFGMSFFMEGLPLADFLFH
jgi:hypothetical protein